MKSRFNFLPTFLLLTHVTGQYRMNQPQSALPRHYPSTLSPYERIDDPPRPRNPWQSRSLKMNSNRQRDDSQPFHQPRGLPRHSALWHAGPVKIELHRPVNRFHFYPADSLPFYRYRQFPHQPVIWRRPFSPLGRRNPAKYIEYDLEDSLNDNKLPGPSLATADYSSLVQISYGKDDLAIKRSLCSGSLIGQKLVITTINCLRKLFSKQSLGFSFYASHMPIDSMAPTFTASPPPPHHGIGLILLQGVKTDWNDDKGRAVLTVNEDVEFLAPRKHILLTISRRTYRLSGGIQKEVPGDGKVHVSRIVVLLQKACGLSETDEEICIQFLGNSLVSRQIRDVTCHGGDGAPIFTPHGKNFYLLAMMNSADCVRPMKATRISTKMDHLLKELASASSPTYTVFLEELARINATWLTEMQRTHNLIQPGAVASSDFFNPHWRPPRRGHWYPDYDYTIEKNSRVLELVEEVFPDSPLD